MFKKILSGILAAAMALSFPVVSMGADTISIGAVVSESSIEVGDEFYVDFKVTDNPTGYNSMQCYVDFDASKVEALECDVPDIPDDLILYTDENGVNYSIFSYTNVNGRINFVPSQGDADYLGKADGQTPAGKLGRIKLANLLSDREDNVRVNYTGTGTLLRMKFRAIDSGSLTVEMNDVVGSYTNAEGSTETLAFDVSGASIDIAGGSSSEETETTTATETTTSSQSGGSSGGSGGGGGLRVTTTTEATTEAVSEGTTEDQTVIGGADGPTDITAVSFTDVADNFWGRSYIEELASQGIINGYPDGTFRPNDNVKRADFLIMLLRGLGIDTSAPAGDNFTDVANNAYYANACSIAKEMGIATGNPDGSFAPESYITRQDMMILAKKALESELGSEITGDVTVLDKFSDKADISPYAVESLAAMTEMGIVNGMNGGIAPKANTTRVQAAVIVSNILENIG